MKGSDTDIDRILLKPAFSDKGDYQMDDFTFTDHEIEQIIGCPRKIVDSPKMKILRRISQLDWYINPGITGEISIFLSKSAEQH